ncbi:MAG: hypothetical protein HY912_19835 [Desulfomonile tiedjei]|uniref:Uncharacterized protein n=1 Tax=Desulfomonile tiedjei TaxID=2358 RepID=A0A9D6V468_9BACT|nr:hypothetical protein [Desulfomonile tiedjei]
MTVISVAEALLVVVCPIDIPAVRTEIIVVAINVCNILLIAFNFFIPPGLLMV